MLGDRRLIVILGLSKGGTNHLAQVAHACQDVVGLNEGVSRLVHPTRQPGRQILTPEAVQAGVLRPVKSFEQAAVVSVNKVNYTLVVYPEAWARFLAEDDKTDTVVLLRNPLMVHRSRVAYAGKTKPQRTRWLDADQLGRELAELLALAWRLPRARLVFHERGLTDRYAHLLHDTLGLHGGDETAPNDCPNCRRALTRKRRSADDPNDWLYCAACQRFIEGTGDYNYIRREDNPDKYRADEAAARDDDVIRVLCQWLGRGPVDVFLEGLHWTDRGEPVLREVLDGDADRWQAVPLNEILYPY